MFKINVSQALVLLLWLSCVAGCQTGSVKGQIKTTDAFSFTLPALTGESNEPTELKFKVDAVVNAVSSGDNVDNASGKFEVKDENLDREYKGIIKLGLIGNGLDSVPGPNSLATQMNASPIIAALADGLRSVTPNFGLTSSNRGPSSLSVAAFLGELKVEDVEDETGLFIALILDIPTTSVVVLPGSGPNISTIVGFATITDSGGYVAVGVSSNASKLKWKVAPVPQGPP